MRRIVPRTVFCLAQLVQRILEAHANLKDLALMEAKMNYIKAWQSLPEFGISLFVVKFMGHKKEELLGIAYNRLMRMDIATGDHVKTWRYNTMKVRFCLLHLYYDLAKRPLERKVQFNFCFRKFVCLSAPPPQTYSVVAYGTFRYVFLMTF